MLIKQLHDLFVPDSDKDDGTNQEITFHIANLLSSDPNLHENIVGSLMQALKKTSKLCLAKATFKPEVATSLLDLLSKLAPLVGNNDDNRKLLRGFITTFVRFHGEMADFERLSVQVQSRLLKLLLTIVKIDPKGEWSKWKGGIHNLTGTCRHFEFF